MSLIFESSDGAWGQAVAVTCVECPDCAFTFDATHEDKDGGYSCPQCDQLALQAENDRLREALRRIEAGETVLGGNGIIRGDASVIAHKALAQFKEKP